MNNKKNNKNTMNTRVLRNAVAAGACAVLSWGGVALAAKPDPAPILEKLYKALKGESAEPEEWTDEERWQRLPHWDQWKLVRERIMKLARMHAGEIEPFSVSDAELKLLEKRQLDICRLYSVAERFEDRKKSFPVLSDEAPRELSAEEQARLTRLFASSWEYGEALFQGRPEELGKDGMFLLKSLGFSDDLEGIAQIVQTKPETRSGVERIILQYWQLCCLPINVPGSKARLYWWNKDGTRCLLYLLPHQALIFAAPAPGKIVSYCFWDCPYYRKLRDAEAGE